MTNYGSYKNCLNLRFRRFNASLLFKKAQLSLALCWHLLSNLLPPLTDSVSGEINKSLGHWLIDWSALQCAAQSPKHNQKYQRHSHYNPEWPPIRCQSIPVLNHLDWKVSCHQADWQEKDGQFRQKYGDARKAFNGLSLLEGDKIKILVFFILAGHHLNGLRWTNQKYQRFFII